MDTGPLMNLADDLNAVIIMVASCTSQGLLLLFYINIETLPIEVKTAIIVLIKFDIIWYYA